MWCLISNTKLALENQAPMSIEPLAIFLEMELTATNPKAFVFFMKQSFVIIRACLNRAICYVKGIGMESNHIEATRLFNKAASLGSIMALRFLGYCALKGFGSDLNAFEAVRLSQNCGSCWRYRELFRARSSLSAGGRRRARHF
jgi:TPR repeat protein